MVHIAILNKRLAKIEDILSGKKTIESRWYKHKIAPWGKIKKGEVVYFKKSGGMVEASAKVRDVICFDNASDTELIHYIDKYRGEGYINLKSTTSELLTLAKDKKYIMFIFLEDVKKVKPFQINKEGFGNACAWMCMDKIMIKK